MTTSESFLSRKAMIEAQLWEFAGEYLEIELRDGAEFVIWGAGDLRERMETVRERFFAVVRVWTVIYDSEMNCTCAFFPAVDGVWHEEVVPSSRLTGTCAAV